MCVETSPRSGCQKSSCTCGGHGGRVAPADPSAILTMEFGEGEAHQCNCNGRTCPRHYLAWSGFVLGGFLVLHLAVNTLGLWPARFQTAVNRIHGLGAAQPVLEIALIFIPLAIHMAFGLRTLWREKLKFGIEKHHHGNDLRQWLQRVSALILLAFITFHVVTLHRWFGGRFDPHNAIGSVSQALWQFWPGLPAGHPVNLLVAEFYLLGIAAAVYHLANGIATGSEVLGFTAAPAAQQRLWRTCLAAAPVLLLAGLAAWHAFAMK
jgi:succinate dehydrogenase / fumarate reductase cytochrome b subunit